MTAAHWIGIAVVVFLLLVWVTKGRIFKVFGDIIEAILD